jgi:superfamily I DNA/RNA helicase
LKQLKVPVAHYGALLDCASEEALLAAPVPADVLERILDTLFPRPLDEVVKQPDLVVAEPNDLVRYAGGELLTFLLKLDDDQQKLVHWALKGPTMIKGGAGTGKSTVAMHRVRAFLSRPNGGASGRVLFTTYTRALIAASRQLLAQLLTPEQLARVEVSTCDEVARAIVGSTRKVRTIETDLLSILRRVRKDFSPSGKSVLERTARAQHLAQLPDRYLLDEFEWIIEGRALATLQAYLDAPRPGRGIALKPAARAAIWELHEAFAADLTRKKLETFAGLGAEALALVRTKKWTGHYDFVVVDEAQDLAPVALGLMAEVAKDPEGLFFAADEKQSLYSKNYSWSQANPRLTFTGRTAILKRNYRSTAEIDQAAFDVLVPEDGEVLERSSSPHSGPLPVLARDWPTGDVANAVGSFIRQMAKHFHMKLSASAVLVPTAEAGKHLESALTLAGLPARYFAGRDLDLSADVVKVITLHSAKGLEFPIVFLTKQMKWFL